MGKGQAAKGHVLQVGRRRYQPQLRGDDHELVRILVGAPDIGKCPWLLGSIEEPLSGLRQIILDILDKVAAPFLEPVRVLMQDLMCGRPRHVDDPFGAIDTCNAQPGRRILLEVDELDISDRSRAHVREILAGVDGMIGCQVAPGARNRVGCVVDEAIETQEFAFVGSLRLRGARTSVLNLCVDIDGVLDAKIGAQIPVAPASRQRKTRPQTSFVPNVQVLEILSILGKRCDPSILSRQLPIAHAHTTADDRFRSGKILIDDLDIGGTGIGSIEGDGPRFRRLTTVFPRKKVGAVLELDDDGP